MKNSSTDPATQTRNAGRENVITLRALLTLLFALPLCLRALGCTVMIVAASATDDGRPLLFKNRDSSSAYMVDIKADQHEGFRFVAQYALCDDTWEGPWSGFNEQGFCIANSLSYNYSGAEYASMNRVILDMALRRCSTASDFEVLIDSLAKPMDVRANFAVVDAQGSAVFYEVGPGGYTKYDANDPLTAPDGYLIRTNYSLAGDQDRRVGEDRMVAAERFATEAVAAHQLNGRYILQNMPRYLVHSNGTVLYDNAPATWDVETPADFDGFIPRHSSTNAMLIQGVRAGESPLLTVCWSIMGPPMATVAQPLFITPHNILPAKSENGWLSERGQALKGFIFPYQENATKVVDWSKLYNREGTGIMQRILCIEDEIIERGCSLIVDARQSGALSEESLADYYSWLDGYIEREYEYHFADIAASVATRQSLAGQHSDWWDIRGMRRPDRLGFRGVIVGRQGKRLM
ncbi:MAG: hypothetical protein K6F94_03475 [Bacteroidaceae bacterium]|nr:hypothetical protein [Bacteroidaceae bacterium]